MTKRRFLLLAALIGLALVAEPPLGRLASLLAATASDDFNRADGALGSNWTTVIGSGGEVAGNYARGNSASESGSMWAVASTDFTDDHESQITKANDAFTNFGGPAVRLTTASGGNGYIYFNHGALERLDAGTRFNIGTFGTFTVGDVVRLRITGTTLEGWINGASQGTVIDATYSTGQPGIYFFGDDSGGVDDWSATDVGGGGGGGSQSCLLLLCASGRPEPGRAVPAREHPTLRGLRKAA